MNLLVDQGNTSLKMALFNNNLLLEKVIFLNNEYRYINKWFEEFVRTPVNIIQSSVVEKAIDFSTLDIQTFIKLDEQTEIPIINRYKTPQTLGKDRLANAVACWALNKNKASLAIDLGTCIKYDLVDSNGAYLGGAISPGLEMRYIALNNFTDKLPLINASTDLLEIGDDTVSSIQTGVQQGIMHEINGFIKRYSEEYEGLTIFMTGGDAKYFDKGFKNTIFVNPNLSLIGLNEILHYNVQKTKR